MENTWKFKLYNEDIANTPSSCWTGRKS